MQSLKESRGNLTLAASLLGIDRKVLRELMQKLDLNKEDFKV
jgi:DNA-binding protein Fis